MMTLANWAASTTPLNWAASTTPLAGAVFVPPAATSTACALDADIERTWRAVVT